MENNVLYSPEPIADGGAIVYLGDSGDSILIKHNKFYGNGLSGIYNKTNYLQIIDNEFHHVPELNSYTNKMSHAILSMNKYFDNIPKLKGVFFDKGNNMLQ